VTIGIGWGSGRGLAGAGRGCGFGRLLLSEGGGFSTRRRGGCIGFICGILGNGLLFCEQKMLKNLLSGGLIIEMTFLCA